MKNKKLGFTLIELLAVIIILAVVALIATPTILDVINEAKISAGKSEANMILGGINNYCVNEEMKYQLDDNYNRICTTNMTVDNVKEMVNLGDAEIKEILYNGRKLVTLVIKSNNHTFTLCQSGRFAVDEESCPQDPNSLITKLLAQYSEGKTTGLLKDEENEKIYYYKGLDKEVANNYLWYGGHQWRVLEFDISAKTLTLITQQPLTSIQPSSAVWKTKEEYESSYINKWLNEYFWNSLDSSIQSNILDNTYNVGICNNVSEITTVLKVGLLDLAQYERAGNQNSFLNIKDYFWLGNRYDSSSVRVVNNNGDFGYSSLSAAFGVRAVIKISDLTITEGDGTLANSYRTSSKATTTSEVQVGEYINVPYEGEDNACGDDNMCTFRVVSKDNDSIKVVLNGLLPITSKYGSNETISTSHTIYTTLNNFAEKISNNYRFIENKSFYIGDYPSSSTNYKDIEDETLQANIGLPTVGEMFSGNDLDLSVSSTKIFVDVNTIENPTTSSWYWTMNRYNSSIVRSVSSHGNLNSDSISALGGVRVVIYLKSGTSNITFTGGEGTAQSPYVLQ